MVDADSAGPLSLVYGVKNDKKEFFEVFCLWQYPRYLKKVIEIPEKG